MVAEAGQSLTDALIKKLRKAEINKVKVFVTSGRAECTMVKNTLAKDPDGPLLQEGKRRAARVRRRFQDG